MNFEDAWEIMGNVEERCKWDKRWETPKILENEGHGEVKMWMAIPKPPIPGFWQRDLVVHSKVMQKTDDVVYTQATSIEHPDYPAGQGGMMEYVRLHLFFHGVKVERAGDGVKLTEVRHFDLSGQVIQAILDGGKVSHPKENFQHWSRVFDKAVKGEDITAE